jgi:hypothetical protein
VGVVVLGVALTVEPAGAAGWQFVHAAARLGKPSARFAFTVARTAAAAMAATARVVTSRNLISQ